MTWATVTFVLRLLAVFAFLCLAGGVGVAMGVAVREFL